MATPTQENPVPHYLTPKKDIFKLFPKVLVRGEPNNVSGNFKSAHRFHLTRPFDLNLRPNVPFMLKDFTV